MWARLTVRIETTDTLLVERVSDAMWSAGAEGTEVRDQETFSSFAESAFRPPPLGTTEVIGYFPDPGAAEAFAPPDLGVAMRVVAVEPFDPDAWKDSWKQYFPPTRISPRLTVRPSWDDALPPGEHAHVLVVDPGMAFGTGTHETTRLCLELMDRLLLPEGGGARSFLDVGCGSGILSIAADMLGAAPIAGVDIDPDAVAIAAENWALNGRTGPAPFSATPVAELEAASEVVVGNMLSRIVLSLRADLVRLTAPGGALLVSGVLVDEEARFREQFEGPELTLRERAVSGEWLALVYGRR